MARTIDRQKAINLRREGKTYSEIKEILKIPKSTLSGWLARTYFTEEELVRLKEKRISKRLLAIEKTRLTKRKKRDQRIQDQLSKQTSYWKKMTKRELELCGIFLYWGEGDKRLNGPISVNNTDPQVMKFVNYWMLNILKIPKEKIKAILHLYSDMDIKKETLFWSRELNIPVSQFCNAYIKKSKFSELTHRGFGHGTCGLMTNNVLLKEQIIMAIKAISDKYGVKFSPK